MLSSQIPVMVRLMLDVDLASFSNYRKHKSINAFFLTPFLLLQAF
jgi:hypothetical protein